MPTLPLPQVRGITWATQPKRIVLTSPDSSKRGLRNLRNTIATMDRCLRPVPDHTKDYRQETYSKLVNVLGVSNYDGIKYEPRQIGMPQNPETAEAWEYMKWARKPFFVDLLHTHQPWRGDLPGRELVKGNERIARANAATYLGAKWVVMGVPEGGSGPYSASEHRIAGVGSYRLIPGGQYKQDKGTDVAHGTLSEGSSSGNAAVQVSQR